MDVDELLSAVRAVSAVYLAKGWGTADDVGKAEGLLSRFISENWDSRAAADAVRCPQWDYYVVTMMNAFYALSVQYPTMRVHLAAIRLSPEDLGFCVANFESIAASVRSNLSDVECLVEQGMMNETVAAEYRAQLESLQITLSKSAQGDSVPCITGRPLMFAAEIPLMDAICQAVFRERYERASGQEKLQLSDASTLFATALRCVQAESVDGLPATALFACRRTQHLSGRHIHSWTAKIFCQHFPGSKCLGLSSVSAKLAHPELQKPLIGTVGHILAMALRAVYEHHQNTVAMALADIIASVAVALLNDSSTVVFLLDSVDALLMARLFASDGKPTPLAAYISSRIQGKRVFYRLDSGTVEATVEVTELMSIGLGVPVGLIHSEVKDIVSMSDGRVAMLGVGGAITQGKHPKNSVNIAVKITGIELGDTFVPTFKKSGTEGKWSSNPLVHSQAGTVQFVSERTKVVEDAIRNTSQARLLAVFKLCMGGLSNCT
jgi:nicotinic acid phosphoribosyltransferase